MNVVSNASPLINLARIGQFDLLHELYSEIWIPDAFRHEVVVESVGLPGADEVESSAWIHTQAIANTALVQALRQELDAGEAEAIALAIERQADLLLMDERIGREVAQHFGVPRVGLIGLLIDAKAKGHVRAVRPWLDALRNDAGFYIAHELTNQILDDLGE
jgi:predicted nucleic acid-binding protein